MSRSTVPLEGYARMRAEMEAGVLRDEVLLGAGLSGDEWVSAQQEWLEKMGGELERGRFELSRRYTQAFLERQRELAARPQKAPFVAAPPAPSADDATLPAPSADATQPPPPAPSADATLPPLPGFAAALPAFLSSPIRPAAPPIAPPAPVFLPPIERDFGMTGSLDPAIIRAALPFGGASAPSAPAKSELPAPPAKPAPAPPVGSTTGALPADLLARIRKGSLPFPASKVAPSPTTGAPSASTPSTSAPDDGTGTLLAPLQRPTGAELPFRAPTLTGQAPPAPPRSGELTLEQYAQLCVDLAHTPQQAEGVFARYGLSATQDRLRVDLTWRERLRRNPEEYRQWQELYQRYQAQVTERPRS